MPASAVRAGSALPAGVAAAPVGPASERTAACQDSSGLYAVGFQAKSPAVAMAIREATGCCIAPVSITAERVATPGSRPV